MLSNELIKILKQFSFGDQSTFFNPFKNIFIFESDFHFINYDFDLLNKSIKTLNNLDWKLFYLGGTSDVVWGVESENLVRSCVSTTVAYGVNGKYFEEIINKIENNLIYKN